MDEEYSDQDPLQDQILNQLIAHSLSKEEALFLIETSQPQTVQQALELLEPK